MLTKIVPVLRPSQTPLAVTIPIKRTRAGGPTSGYTGTQVFFPYGSADYGTLDESISTTRQELEQQTNASIGELYLILHGPRPSTPNSYGVFTDGAFWTTDNVWWYRDNNGLFHYCVAGTYAIACKPCPGYITPTGVTFSVQQAQTTKVHVRYGRAGGWPLMITQVGDPTLPCKVEVFENDKSENLRTSTDLLSSSTDGNGQRRWILGEVEQFDGVVVDDAVVDLSWDSFGISKTQRLGARGSKLYYVFSAYFGCQPIEPNITGFDNPPEWFGVNQVNWPLDPLDTGLQQGTNAL